MKDATPSRTAHRVAIRRAAHQFMDQPRVFEDPLALKIIGAETAGALAQDPGRFESSTHLRAFIAVRSRYAEDELARAVVERGVRQYVVLGAGLDTFGYRNPHAGAGLRVFEVDHPATQAWKREQLDHNQIAVPGWLTFVPVDFEQQSLADELRRGGFRAGEPSLFAWLGVVPYLTLEAVRATLAFIGRLPRGSGVVFDYANSPESLRPAVRAAFDAMAARVARAGEPFRLFFDPEELAMLLRACGFSWIEDLDAAAINGRYFDGRTDGLRLAEGLAHLVSARV